MVIHIRFEGRSLEVSAQALGVGKESSDQHLKEQVARYLDVAPSRLRFYVIDRPVNGNRVVRPEAVYG